MDRVGTRRGLTISVLWYSTVSLLTSLANGLSSFAAFRFLLERASPPIGRERAKLFRSGFPNASGTGRGILRQRIVGRRRDRAFSDFARVLALGWRVAFVIPGVLGFLWLIAWRRFYYPPQEHPRISDAERQMILAEKTASRIGRRSSAAMARPSEAAANLGNDYLEGPYRSRMVFRH